VTPRQQTALRYTCRLPEETVHPRYWAQVRDCSTILTFNSGYE
jgi:hypothetical protein